MSSFYLPTSLPTSSVAPYKAGTSVLHGNVEVYGDSISAGVGLTTPATQSYSALLAAQYALTINNFAVNGDGMQDMAVKVYNNHVVDGRTAIVKIGYNDIDFPAYTDANFYLFKEALMNSLLYLSLGSTQLMTGRTGVTTTGTWTNLYNTTGTYCTTTSGTLTATLPVGRYVGFASTAVPTGAVSLTVSIDGATAKPVTIPASAFTTSNGSAFSPIALVFDTGVSAAHTITITFVSAPANVSLNVDYLFGFDDLTKGSPVILIGNEPSNFQQTTTGFTAGTLSRQQLINTVQRQIATMFRQKYLARMTFVEELPYWGFSDKTNDAIHPDANGHRRIRDSVNNALTNGEVVPFA